MVAFEKMPFEDPATAVCFCNFCGNLLRFQPLRTGEIINCVHCGMETLLYAFDVEPTYPQTRSVAVRDVKLETTELGQRYLVGEVVNNSAGDLDWIRVEFVLYGKDSLVVGTTSDSNLNFQPETVWTFRAPIFNSEAIRASLPVFSCEFGNIFNVTNFGCQFLALPEDSAGKAAVGPAQPALRKK